MVLSAYSAVRLALCLLVEFGNAAGSGVGTVDASATHHLLVPRQILSTPGENQYEFTQAFQVTTAGRYVFSVDARSGPAQDSLADAPTCVLTICIASLPCSVQKSVKSSWSTFSSTSYLATGPQSVLFTVVCTDVAYVGFKNIKVPGQLIVAPVTQTLVSTAPGPTLSLPGATQTEVKTLVSELPPATSIIILPQATATETILSQLAAATSIISVFQATATATVVEQLAAETSIIMLPQATATETVLSQLAAKTSIMFLPQATATETVVSRLAAETSIISFPQITATETIVSQLAAETSIISFPQVTATQTILSQLAGEVTTVTLPQITATETIVSQLAAVTTTVSLPQIIRTETTSRVPEVPITSTTTTSSSVPTSSLSCPAANGMRYTDESGVRYDILCGTDASPATEYGSTTGANFGACLTACDRDSRCEAISYNSGNGYCFFKSNVLGSRSFVTYVHVAFKVDFPRPTTTRTTTSTTSTTVTSTTLTTTTTRTTTTSTTSTSFTPAATPPTCPADDNKIFTTTRLNRFTVLCNKDLQDPTAGTRIVATDLGDCLNQCDFAVAGGCKGVSWVPAGQADKYCYFKSATAGIIAQPNGVTVYSAKLTSLMPV